MIYRLFFFFLLALHNYRTNRVPIAIHFGDGGQEFQGAGLERRSHIYFILLCVAPKDQELASKTAVSATSEAKVILNFLARVKYI